MSEKPLNKFETFAQRLFEGTLSRWFGGSERPFVPMRDQLLAALETANQQGQLLKTAVFELHPAVHERVMQEAESWQQALNAAVMDVPNRPAILPNLLFVPNEKLEEQDIRLVPAWAELPSETTQIQHRAVTDDDSPVEAIQQLDAYLVVGGRHHVSLDKPVLTLGRQLDNDVVLEQATVSRHHAQIRWRFGRFILYDLNGRGKTAVNGTPVREHVLHSGDVITLSHVRLIYGESGERGAASNGRSSGGDETQINPPLR